MARGYRQLGRGDYVYRKDSRCSEREYRVESIVLDKAGEPVKVAVRETRKGTVANPGQWHDVTYWSLAQLDAPLPRQGVNGVDPVTDANERRVKRASFDRMMAAAVKQWANERTAQQQREARAGELGELQERTLTLSRGAWLQMVKHLSFLEPETGAMDTTNRVLAALESTESGPYTVTVAMVTGRWGWDFLWHMSTAGDDWWLRDREEERAALAELAEAIRPRKG